MSWASWAFELFDLTRFSWPGFVLALVAAALAAQQVLRFLLLLGSRQVDYRGKHCVVTGGSEGIGFEMAKALLERGAHVTLVARSQAKLDAAVRELLQLRSAPTQQVRSVACDVADGAAVVRALERLDDELAVFCLVANAGVAVTGYFLDLALADFERCMSVNYMGVVHCAKALAPRMVSRRNGQIAIIGSAAGLCGMLGFSAYAPTKWALRGFADSLRQELLPFDVAVSICYPSDVRTPGYEVENRTKPAETLAMSDSGVLASAADAGRHMVARMARGDYHIGTDSLVDLLRVPMTSMSPRANIVLEIVLMPIVGIITTAIGFQWDGIVRRLGPERPDVKRLERLSR
eukprot:Amastigsp_a346242_6.p2 type:complete len:348 gc:universal Amastigsp_a346242_6:1129-86(-)